MDVKYSTDDRSLQEIQQTSDKIQHLSNRNQKHFKVINSDININKQKLKLYPIQDKISHIVQRKTFSKGWYCSYTDNLDSQSIFSLNKQNNIAILTIHGCPGNQKEWLRLEKQFGQNQLRWINFITPGFDGYDERRGDYNSTIQDSAKMVKLLIDSLKIEKLILVGHSMGSYICYYFATYFPQNVLGLVQASAAPTEWYLGMKKFHSAIVKQFNKEDILNPEINTNENLRNQLYQKYLQNKNKYTMNMEGVGSIEMPKLTKFEFLASFKFFGRSYEFYDDIFKIHRNLPKSLKFLTAGNTDIIIEKALFEKTFDYWTYGPLKYDLQQDNINQYELKQILQQDPELAEIQFDFDNFQSNFVFMFNNTGHPVHNRRGMELGKPLRIYVKVLIILENLKNKQKLKPKL